MAISASGRAAFDFNRRRYECGRNYGYVGRAAGFDTETLIQGASLGETVLTGDDDQGDQITMRVGIDLYEKYGVAR